MTAHEIGLPGEMVRQFCARWKVTEMAAFGSVVRGSLRPDSDLDLLVTFADDAEWSLLDLERMREELGQHVGRPVDLMTRRGVERSRNPIIRDEILCAAEIVHAT
jgi:predicted nucleotidyltransferase